MADFLDSVVANAPPEGERGRGARSVQRIDLGQQSRAAEVKMRYQGGRPPTSTHIQNFSQGPNSSAEQVSQVNQFYISEDNFYFELQPFQLGNKAGSGNYVPLPPGTPLRAGRSYRVRVSLSKNKYRGVFQSASPTYKLEQRPFKLSGEIFVYLGVLGQDLNVHAALSQITPGQGRVSLTEFQDFEFTVQKDYRLEFTLELICRKDSEGLPHQAATLTLSLEGSEAAPPPPIDKVFDLPALAAPPPETAFLHVSPASNGRVKLLGWVGTHANSSLSLDIGVFGWIDPEGCADEEAYLRELTNSLHDYSIEQAGGVSAWFETVLKRYGERCSIIITDEASALIPWEMFKLPDGRYVGAHALIVRWPGTEYGGQNANVDGSQMYQGRLCAYVHQLDEGGLANSAEMGRLLPTHYNNPELLERDLMPGAPPVGLVYLCYGGILYYGDEKKTIACLSRFKPYEQDVQIRFNIAGGSVSPRPIFFANAPYSGRIFKAGQQACGLARAILKQVAASYIGTLGPVKRTYAMRFAERLLEAAASSEGVRPAVLLRQLRAEAYKQITDASLSREEFLRARAEFAFPFMYVYYGHPQDWLKIKYLTGGTEPVGGDQNV